jgi:hypothetical protein
MIRSAVLPILLLGACATAPAETPLTPDFKGDYVRLTRVRLPDGQSVETMEGATVGATVDGRATLKVELLFGYGRRCVIDGDAAVTPAGLVYRAANPATQAPFVLAVDIAGAAANLRVVEGDGLWLCGEGGHWDGGVTLSKG